MPHIHTRNIPVYTKDELLDMEYTPGGEIRTHINHPDGTIEYVALNNLVAVVSRFATDLLGNKFGGYFVLPNDFWEYCKKELWEMWGRSPASLRPGASGGYSGIISNYTIFAADVDQVLLCTDHNGLCWSFEVTDTHDLLRRPTIKEMVGLNKGFDDIVVFHPALGVPPRPLLEQWAMEGYDSAKDMLLQLDAGNVPYQLPSGEWILMQKDDVQKLLNSHTRTNIPRLTGVIEGEYTEVG